VGRFWDFYAMHQATTFFSEAYGPSLVSLIAKTQPHTYVDIGSGTGALVIRAARRGIRSIGVEPSPELVRLAVAGAKAPLVPAEFLVGSSTAVPLPDRSADTVSLIEVVEHLGDDVLPIVLAEARRVLRPGGTLLVTTPYREDLAASTMQCPECGAEFHAVQHVRSWTSTSLQSVLNAAGFTPRTWATRMVEDGPIYERAARYLIYRATRARRHLIALAGVQP
jgi:SAM-dependent methyltransferase